MGELNDYLLSAIDKEERSGIRDWVQIQQLPKLALGQCSHIILALIVLSISMSSTV